MDGHQYQHPSRVYGESAASHSEREWDRDKIGRGREWNTQYNSQEDPPAPSRVIVVRGLGPEITEEMLGDVIKPHSPVDGIRVIRRKDTGESRGFGFVDFSDVQTAKSFYEMSRGILRVGNSTASLDYSNNANPSISNTGDWWCASCNGVNFSKRQACYQCGTARSFAAQPVPAHMHLQGQVPHPTSHNNSGARVRGMEPHNVLFVRGLDPSTTEDSVLSSFIPYGVPIKTVKMPREKATNQPRGIAFVEFQTIQDATRVLEMTTNLHINNLPVRVSFAEPRQETRPAPALAAPVPQIPLGFIHDPFNPGIYYNPDTKYYFEASNGRYYYYNTEAKSYFAFNNFTNTFEPYVPNTQNHPAPHDNTPYEPTQPTLTTDTTSSSSSTLQEPGPATHTQKAEDKRAHSPNKADPSDAKKVKQAPSAADIELEALAALEAVASNAIPAPPVHTGPVKFSFTTPSTSSTILISAPPKPASAPAPTPHTGASGGRPGWFAAQQNSDEDEEDEVVPIPQIKAKTAASHALQSQAKFPRYHGASTAPAGQFKQAASEEIEPAPQMPAPVPTVPIPAPTTDAPPPSGKSVCFLCKRQFPTPEALQKHELLSDLHKQNLAIQKQKQESRAEDKREVQEALREERKEMLRQRDADAERGPHPSSSLSEDNVGYKMLKESGWREGHGLGREGQGRTGIVEVNMRTERAGLGSIDEAAGHSLGGAASYRDAVRKRAMQRFESMSGQSLDKMLDNNPFLNDEPSSHKRGRGHK
eukprot:TRINITY_DN3371_c1_g1_i3.p1 TRINITY_DN3371_c1_g1~~TRINITY_DN3371_c1_g1_i3.p1  ORF type:complete len:759 (+),score=143.66 TRINITY_DN3371_c1_g1_i3:834-3110(+)